MNKQILHHYSEFSPYTNPGLYKDLLKKLPDKIEEIGFLVRKQIIHRITLKDGNTGSNSDKRYGDITKVPWFRQCEDDIFPTASAMLAELYRRDKRGFVNNRREEDKLILTCRFIAILMASILKSKSVPCRIRSGFASYFKNTNGKATDHWINEYWNSKEKRWTAIDVDGSLENYLTFDPYDIPKDVFDFSALSWLNVRQGKTSPAYFHDAVGYEGFITIGWELFHDFHSLMNNEIIYQQGPEYVYQRMDKLNEQELKEIDNLAYLMIKPDKNFTKLKEIWETKKKFRILKGGLL